LSHPIAAMLLEFAHWLYSLKSPSQEFLFLCATRCY